MFVFGLDVKDIYCALGSILLLVKEKSLVGLFWLWSRHVTWGGELCRLWAKF